MWFGSIREPCTASTTGMDVQRLRISPSMLLRSGGRCRITTNAMPLSGGMASKKLWNASIPPAEAPIPIIGNAAPLMWRCGMRLRRPFETPSAWLEIEARARGLSCRTLPEADDTPGTLFSARVADRCVVYPDPFGLSGIRNRPHRGVCRNRPSGRWPGSSLQGPSRAGWL